MKPTRTILGWIAGPIVIFYWSIVILTRVGGGMINPEYIPRGPLKLTELAIPLVVLSLFWAAIFFLLKRFKKQNPKARLLLWTALALLLIPFFRDPPAPPPGYTRAHLQQPDDMRASYETLMRFQTGGERSLDYEFPTDLPSDKVWTNLLPQADRIEQAWSDCAEGRKYIHDLNQFNAIADYIDYSGPPAEVPVPSFKAAHAIARTIPSTLS